MDVAFRNRSVSECDFIFGTEDRRVVFFLLYSYLGGIMATRVLHDVNHIGIALLAVDTFQN